MRSPTTSPAGNSGQFLSRPTGTLHAVPEFKVVSDFAPAGDQPEAIAALAEGINRGDRFRPFSG
jgi:hypothetical protein